MSASMVKLEPGVPVPVVPTVPESKYSLTDFRKAVKGGDKVRQHSYRKVLHLGSKAISRKEKSKKVVRVPNRWNIHLSNFRKVHPDMKDFKSVLLAAKESYVRKK